VADISRINNRYMNSMKKKGYSKVCIWVPTEDQERVLKYAAKLRKQKEKRDA
jgi:hypothetical protein